MCKGKINEGYLVKATTALPISKAIGAYSNILNLQFIK